MLLASSAETALITRLSPHFRLSAQTGVRRRRLGLGMRASYGAVEQATPGMPSAPSHAPSTLFTTLASPGQRQACLLSTGHLSTLLARAEASPSRLHWRPVPSVSQRASTAELAHYTAVIGCLINIVVFSIAKSSSSISIFTFFLIFWRGHLFEYGIFDFPPLSRTCNKYIGFIMLLQEKYNAWLTLMPGLPTSTYITSLEDGSPHTA